MTDHAAEFNASIAERNLVISANLSKPCDENDPFLVHIDADGVTINGHRHAEPILAVTASPPTDTELASVTVQFAIGALSIDSTHLTVTTDDAGTLHFHPIP